MINKHNEPVIGVPYFVGVNPYQRSFIYGDPGGIPIRQTMYRDTPAPFNCPFCGNSGLTFIRSKLSLAAMVACTMPFMLGICFLCPSMDCLWHKYHFCPHCAAKVGEFEKTDPCVVVDMPQWMQESYAIPA
ncbi:hypothetical protein V6N13_085533 [Hibiscus sabdariffa]|uniref:LITAF domain-containing protein n=1 Tax=Hibiscus sabdariffa TaxID=183260 RepID=A0ABR2D1V8_9ROSI